MLVRVGHSVAVGGSAERTICWIVEVVFVGFFVVDLVLVCGGHCVRYVVVWLARGWRDLWVVGRCC